MSCTSSCVCSVRRRGTRRPAAGPALADRHPLVDPLVHLPLFARARQEDAPGTDVDAW
ncbi:hypothetical protein [Streptomyces tendae]|uniref:hypothetical protein n=1 Tax=Streptomyces tendae TaxID=1932 RepID=UPI003EBC100A